LYPNLLVSLLRPVAFGGIYSYQMAADFKYLQAIFKQTITGSASWGLNVCSDYFLMYSSTDGAVCAALFRIRNSVSAAVAWAPTFSYTAYSGWGERASLAMNGVNYWTSSGQDIQSIAQCVQLSQLHRVFRKLPACICI